MKIKLKAWVHEPVRIGVQELEIDDDPENEVLIFRVPVGVAAAPVSSEVQAAFGVDRGEFRRALKALM